MLTNKQQLGALGEAIIVKFLKKKSFCILARNKRIGRSEFDIIATKNIKGKKLYVFEVKTRTGLEYGFPEESVTLKKLNNFARCYEALLEEYRCELIVYIVVSVIYTQVTNEAKIKFFKIN